MESTEDTTNDKKHDRIWQMREMCIRDRTKIESRPIEGRNWEYRFFVDFEGNMAEPAVKNAMRGLREEARCV